MDKTFWKSLAAIDETDFNLLEQHFYLARQVRNTMIKGALNEAQMAEILQVKEKDMKAVVNGAYEYDFRFMALLQAHNESKAAADAKFKVEAEQLQFADYKYKHPVWVNKVEDLCELLEKHLKAAQIQ